MPKDSSRLCPLFSSAQGASRMLTGGGGGGRGELWPHSLFWMHFGEKIQFWGVGVEGGLALWGHKDTEARGGTGLPKSLRESRGHLPPRA